MKINIDLIRGEIDWARDGRDILFTLQWVAEYCGFTHQPSIYLEPTIWFKRVAEFNIHISRLLEWNIHVDPRDVAEVVADGSPSNWQ